MNDDRDPEGRPQPPRVGRDPICDICGKTEHDCRRTPEPISGHTYQPRRRLHVVDKRST